MEAYTLPQSANLAPDTGKPLENKVRFGIGFALVSVLWCVPFAMGSGVLLPQLFTTIPGISAENAIGSMNSISVIFALIANIVFGTFSDISKFRIGKRTPWIVLGGIIGGAGYFLTAQSKTLFWIVTGWCIVQIGINCIIAPAVAVLSDRIPEATRGTFSAIYGAGQIVGMQLGNFIGSFFLAKLNAGLVIGTLLFLFSGLITVIIWPREKSAEDNTRVASVGDILRSFIPPTKNSRDFYLALIGRLTFTIGMFMISGYQLLILKRYIHLTRDQASSAIQIISLITMVATIVASVVSGPLSDFLQRRKVMVALGCILTALGLLMPWIMPTTTGMYLYAVLGGLGNGCYMSVDQALNVDVLPSAEQAGKDLGILNLSNTIGQALAPWCTTVIFGAFGGYKLVFPAAAAFLLVGTIAIMMIRKVK
ncbi:Na+/melibiose symporter [Bifidobacterium bohemicum]|uniref:Major facilitator superfamily transporter n=1 Tax=Bifidobacterium bohemicum DSM 22767 TaxID=1437606 RepID=A0A086ZGN9_9BIFI|nr:MFS transporter [Bifidobacterium bohemicum]KFI45689.1 major facilitator superfamily transporter [Bifidobacterium bohemicum DSM 22767]SCC07135.1 Na+/melibiose symporter [Bifidobacterium bohemicum]